MSNRRLLAATGTLVAALILPGIAAHAAHTRTLTSPKAAALTVSDLPHGFTVISGTLLNNSQMAQRTKVPKKQFDQHGRLTGYEQAFQGNNVRSYVTVNANIYLYKSAAGARWDYVQSLVHDKKQFKITTAPKVGDESSGLVYNATVSKRQVSVYAVAFHKGTVDSTVGVSGLTGHVTMNDAVHFARIVAGRIH